MSSNRHGDKDVRKAISEARKDGWTVKPGKGHRWGTLLCGHGCSVGVWSSPQSPTTFAKRIREQVAKCPHHDDED